MDAKDLRTEPALSERNNDSGKYSQSSGIALHCDRNKSYQDIGSNSLPKVEVQGTRPCAVIGPDRVVPPSVPTESYIKKGPLEPWPCMDNFYHMRRPPEYPHKLANFQNTTRNISPRQTFQENMQRIMVPPSYNSVKVCEDMSYTQLSERNNVLPKNIKINVPSEAKFCDVPYTVFPPNNEQKNVRNPDMCLPNVNPNVTRTAPHAWPGSVNVRPSRTYGAQDLYQYQDYSNCAGPRTVMSRPNRTAPEDSGYVYADPFFHQEGNIRFKPYPTVKERFPQQRYDYVSNYANSFHPQPTFQSHKYELQKPVPPHPYNPYPPIKYMDRVSEPTIDGYQRNQQSTYNVSYRHQLINPNYGPVLGACTQNKVHSYPPDGHIKSVGPNKISYENSKGYIEYENGRPKIYSQSEGYLVNEMGRIHPMKSQVIMPSYPSLNMHGIPPNPYYKKDSQPIKNYEYIQTHFRTMDPNMNMHNPMARHPQIFSPHTLPISPTDSSVSNDPSQALGTAQEDCGYASQSSTASVRSIDSGMNRMPNDYIRKYYDSRFGPINRNAAMMSKTELHITNASKEKKNIDVRQFLQMWNEGDEEAEENMSKGIIQAGSKTDGNFNKSHEVISQANQEQLYVLGLVNVSSEELGKYEHIQKVSKLPENIKGYNHIELLNQFEEAIESSNITNYKTSKDFQMAPKVTPLNKSTCAIPPRPLSPLDVEAKISQSVIHKEVGCNFEIKPCSPKMMNVEVATPVQNILLERVIEKVANPVTLKSPRLNDGDENIGCNITKKDHRLNMNDETNRIPSCKMINTQFSNNNSIDTIKNSYSLQDLESNSGLCLASLPRLDNDIELNFPEVNQQFINANKRDSSCLTASPMDLPTLEVLEQDNQSKDKLKDSNSLTHEADNLKSPCVPDSEKEFSKLSKYRKTRTHSTVTKDNKHAVRTDSVIIKNPDNVKNYEEQSILLPNPVITQGIQQAPINLTSQGNVTDDANNISLLPQQNEINKETETSIGIAIDFSLKNITNDDAQCMDIIIDKEAETLSQNNCETKNPILNQQINEPSKNTDINQNDSNCHIKVHENYSHSEVYSNTQTIKEINSVDTPIEKAFTSNEYIAATIIETKQEYMSPVLYEKDVNDDNSNSLIPIDFITPPVELSRTSDRNSGDYLMDLDKDIEISMKNLNNIQTPSTVEDLKTCNEHDPNIFDSSLRDTTIIKETVVKQTQSKLKASKDNELSHLLQVSEFSNIKQSDRNNMDLRKEDSETRDTLKSETTEENINSNFDLSPLSSNNAHNNNSEAVYGETQSSFELSSTNSLIEPNSSDYLTETAKQKLLANINNSLNDMYAENSASLEKSDQESNDTTENMERDFFSNFNIPSPNHLVMSKQDNPSETTDVENGTKFDMTTHSEREITNQADISSVTNKVEAVSNLNSTSPTNSSTATSEVEIVSYLNSPSPNDSSTATTEVETVSYLNSTSPNNSSVATSKVETASSLNSASPNNSSTATSKVDNVSNMYSGFHSSSTATTEVETVSDLNSKFLNNSSRENTEVETVSDLNSVYLYNSSTANTEVETVSNLNSASLYNSSIAKTEVETVSNLKSASLNNSSTANTEVETVSNLNSTSLNNSSTANTEVETVSNLNSTSLYNSSIAKTEVETVSNLKSASLNNSSTANSEIETVSNLNSASRYNSSTANTEVETVSNLKSASLNNSSTANSEVETVSNLSSASLYNSSTANTEVETISNVKSASLNNSSTAISEVETVSNLSSATLYNSSTANTEMETVSNLNSASLINSYQSDLRPLDTDSNVTDITSLKETHDRYNVELNSIEGRMEDFLKEEASDIKYTLSIDDTSCESSSIENTDANIPNKCTVRNGKEIHRDVRYLSYGSKEMYSQTIQNLIMFHEGNTRNIRSISSTLSRLETEQVKVLNHSSSDDASSTPQHEDDDTEDSLSPVDASPSVEKPEYVIHQNNCESIEDIKDITKTDELPNTDFMNHAESKFPETFEVDNNRVFDDTCTWPINFNDTIGNLEIKCDKLNMHCNVDRISCSSSSETHEEQQESNFNIKMTLEDSRYIVDEEKFKQLEKKDKAMDEIPQQLENNMKCSNETPGHWDKSSPFYDKAPVKVIKNERMLCHTEFPKQTDNLDINNKQTLEDWESPSNNNYELHPQDDKQSNYSSEVNSQCNEETAYNYVLSESNQQSEDCHKQSHVNKISKKYDRTVSGCSELLDTLDKHSKDKDIETSIKTQSHDLSCSKVQSTENNLVKKSRRSLKRSISDSALNLYNSNEPSQSENDGRVHFIWPFKRRKMNSANNDVLAQNLCNIIQSNRRNSISSIYNEENVSFCILIDNSCVISEEENDNQENLCFTEISQECLAEVQNECVKENVEIIPEIILTQDPPEQDENHCQYSESYVLEGEDGNLEESWVEDVACVETIFNDDIAEDIEISQPLSPKDEDIFSGNDESGFFFSREHTDKVKFIYGDKMCNDDAHFVETLYNTPQMNVNKTLIQRETHISGEYYDNDSLEKILSESHDQGQAPCMSPHSEPGFFPRPINVKLQVDDKDIMSLKTNSSIETINDVVDSDIPQIKDKNENLGHFNTSQDRTVHSCESSVDNVFTYKEDNEKPRYITSSSPEVSSTTSEEKSSAILLKITNYKGSRISQINDSIRNNKSPRCKFTENKGYAQSQSNFTTHRPLLTKGAQKYIPPLKESIRDLKVKLSLPQHSLIKLKQLKQSKDQPKVCKQSISVSKISMKPKPKFEDVLKSIDEIQFQRHKEKTKKSKKSIPKVVIKKNENGSHYASTSNKNEYNPDLTGRKWQPWVFIEKNHFIDKMAIKKKTKAIYSHRKQTYVLAEKFQKYKSVHAKFVISPPLSDCPSAGLKYTIRLKHNY